MRHDVLFLTLIAGAAAAHGQHEHMGPLNPTLGTHGWPDCTPGPLGVSSDLEANQHNMVCHQRKGPATALKVACIGDSITAGAHASNAAHAYPGQLQTMVDPTKYVITNLGACGSTMQKAPNGDSPYWQRPQYQTLINGTWDIVVIMLCVALSLPHPPPAPSPNPLLTTNPPPSHKAGGQMTQRTLSTAARTTGTAARTSATSLRAAPLWPTTSP